MACCDVHYVYVSLCGRHAMECVVLAGFLGCCKAHVNSTLGTLQVSLQGVHDANTTVLLSWLDSTLAPRLDAGLGEER